MIKSYLTIAWRNLWRNKAFSFINITGLSLGVACSLLILLWVQHEYQIDHFHVNNPQLYNVIQHEITIGETGSSYGTPGMLSEELKKMVPEIQYAAAYTYDGGVFCAGDKVIRKQGGYAGGDFFTMLSFPLVIGQPATALKMPGSIAVSASMATTLFGSPAAAMGQVLRYNNNQNQFTVTAVYADMPASSSFQFDYLINWYAFVKKFTWAATWSSTGVHTVVQLRREASATAVKNKIRNFLDSYYINQGPGLHQELDLQPFADQYLHNRFSNGIPSGGRIEYVRLFSLVAGFILLIACINFMNLTTARSVKRAKEIGIRKASGALRGALIRQFITEALVLVILAVAVALLLVFALLPAFNTITHKQVTLPVSQPLFWMQLMVIIVSTGLIAGSYPAFYLSGFQPVTVLKGVVQHGKGEISLRKGLVVFQFVISFLLITAAITVSRQVNYIRTKSPGYDKEHLINIPVEGALIQHYSAFKQAALNTPGVLNVTVMTGSLTGTNNSDDGITWAGKQPDYRPTFQMVTAGYDYIKTSGLQLIAGRDFSTDFPTDTNAVIVNQTTAKKTGFSNPIGQLLTMEDGSKRPIIGVVRDFHTSSLQYAFDPVIILFGEQAGWGNIIVKTAPDKIPQSLASLEQLCKKINPAFPFRYSFADEDYERLYRNEQTVMQLSHAFAILAIIISCLGLLGLAMFSTQQRTKETGIRKILGANNLQLFTLLSKEFVFLLFLSFLIAIPASWWIMHTWLNGYVWHVTLPWWIFAAAGGVAFVIALVMVCTQTVKAALNNPVNNLRAE